MTPASSDTFTLTHSRVSLRLHELVRGSGSPLLLLHGLGEQSPSEVPDLGWNGPVWALDFTGHGQSTVPAGGGYTCETLASDVDVAVAHLGPVTVLGRGLGGYLVLLAAAGRPESYRGIIIADGPGLYGGSSGPRSATWINPVGQGVAPDVFALAELSTDIRPVEYAASLARLVVSGSALETPIIVAAKARPEWLEAVVAEPGVDTDSAVGAMEFYGAT